MASKHIDELLNTLPDKPGVYLMKNKDNQVIYVGKAISLNKRVRQYFRSSKNHSPKVIAMVENITDIDYLIADNEVEALVLESNLIKEHKPRYNIMLKDDKHYPYLAIDLDEYYPRVRKVRKMKKGNIRYFGPYLGGLSLKNVMKTINNTFPLRTCNRDIAKSISRGERPCLNLHIGKCVGPCTGNVSEEEYGVIVKQVIKFLEGYGDEVAKELEEKMLAYSAEMKYELAATYRDRLNSLKDILGQRQRVISESRNDLDLIAVSNDSINAVVQLFVIRGGKMLGSTSVDMTGANYMDDTQIIGSFIQQYYHNADIAPQRVLVSTLPNDKDTLEKWLSGLIGKKARIYVPQRGEFHSLIKMVQKNADQSLKKMKLQKQQEWERTGGALKSLAKHLSMDIPPSRMECYDISNIQGVETVASMVVFIDGKPAKKEYRRFKIQTVTGPDDFASMREVIDRRFKRGIKEKAEGKTTGFAHIPDLVIIDGGMGQLSSAVQSIKELGLTDIPLIGLAKREEEIFRPGSGIPIILSKTEPALHMIQRIRDEAHRFAITYHRSLRQTKGLRSKLENISGIGPARRKALMKHFPSIAGVKAASISELAEVQGMNEKLAKAVYDYFHIIEDNIIADRK